MARFQELCRTAAREVLKPGFSRAADSAASPRTGSRPRSLASLQRRCRRVPSAFLGRDTALTAGCAPQASLSYVIPLEASSFPPGETRRCGVPLDELLASLGPSPGGSSPGGSSPAGSFAEDRRDVSLVQIILLEPGARGITQSALLARRSLTGLLPGFMAKSLGTQTSVKLHREAVRHGFQQDHWEEMIREAYAPLAAGEISVITGLDCDREIALLAPLIQGLEEARNALFQERIRRGYEECGLQRDCGSCEESLLCGNFRRLEQGGRV